MRDFQKIIVWQKAHALAVSLTGVVEPSRFRFRPGLRSQLLRSVDAIGALIAEGAGQPSEAEFVRYLHMAMATAREAENHLLVARDVGCMEQPEADRRLVQLDEVRRILYSYTNAIRPKRDAKR